MITDVPKRRNRKRRNRNTERRNDGNTTNMPNIGDLNIYHHDVEPTLLPKSSTGYNSTIARALHFVSNNRVTHNMNLKVYQD